MTQPTVSKHWRKYLVACLFACFSVKINSLRRSHVTRLYRDSPNYVGMRLLLTTRHRASTSMYSLTFRVTAPPQYGQNGTASWAQWDKTKVWTDSSTEFGLNPIFIDRISIESAAGSNPMLIVLIRTALDPAVALTSALQCLQPVEHDAE